MSYPKVHGTAELISDPKSGPSRNGGRWCNAVVKFVKHRKQTNGTWVEVESFVAVIMAFDDHADMLSGFAKGQPVEVIGTAAVGEWNGKPQMQITIGATGTGVRRPVKADQGNALPARPAPRPDVVPTSFRTRSHLSVVS